MTGRAERDPCADLKGALPPATKQHLASITAVPRVSELLRAIDGYAWVAGGSMRDLIGGDDRWLDEQRRSVPGGGPIEQSVFR